MKKCEKCGMEYPCKENGWNQCAICEKWFVFSDPQTYEFENGKSICKDCLREINK